jgi:hypothetical protein
MIESRVIVPVDPDVEKTQDVARKHRQERLQRRQVSIERRLEHRLTALGLLRLSDVVSQGRLPGHPDRGGARAFVSQKEVQQ